MEREGLSEGFLDIVETFRGISDRSIRNKVPYSNAGNRCAEQKLIGTEVSVMKESGGKNRSLE